MKAGSWDALGLESLRMWALIVAIALGVGVAVVAVAYPLLGQVALVLGTVIALGSGYVTATLPLRSAERSALQQAREAPALAAAASVYLQSTRSKTKTVLALQSDEPRLTALLSELGRTTLLGVDPADSYARQGGRTESQSVSKIFGLVVRAQGESLADEGEELEGMSAASLAGEETNSPVFLTISFFLPIMLMLLAAVGHHTGLIAMVSLTFLEVVVLDLAFSLSSSERGKLTP